MFKVASECNSFNPILRSVIWIKLLFRMLYIDNMASNEVYYKSSVNGLFFKGYQTKQSWTWLHRKIQIPSLWY